MKRLVSLFLFLFLFCSASLHSEEAISFPKESMQVSWNNIFNSLEMLEIEQKNMQDLQMNLEKQIIDLTQLSETQQKQIESWENAYNDLQILYQTSEYNLQKSELSTKKWKICCLVFCGTTVTSVLTLIVIELAGR